MYLSIYQLKYMKMRRSGNGWRAFFTIFLTIIVVVSTQKHDATLEPYSKGSAVVRAACQLIENSCIFPDDKLFCRRLGYVESLDGNEEKTFRPSYNGGIWQVDSDMFNLTQQESVLNNLTVYITAINSNFGINWRTLRWEDCLKPLHSALAARLYIQSRSNNATIPRPIVSQAHFWKSYYRPAGDNATFVNRSNQLEQNCKSGRGADITFVLDDSGSIGASNFVLIKNFVKQVCQGFDIGPGDHQHRIGVVKYSTRVTQEFHLNRYFNITDILRAIEAMIYTGGNTNTHLALYHMVYTSFTTTNGARPKDLHPRVAIVVTDGISNSPPDTIIAANLVHNESITSFAVGVGSSLNHAELNAIATDPDCIYKILLANFVDFEGLSSIIERKTCEAPIITEAGGSSINIELLPGVEQNFKITISAQGATIQLATWLGTSTFYMSYTDYPSSAIYDKKVESVPGRPGVLFIPAIELLSLARSQLLADSVVFGNLVGDIRERTNITLNIAVGDSGASDALKQASWKLVIAIAVLTWVHSS